MTASAALIAVGLYAGLALLMNFALQVLVIGRRRAARVALGTGGDAELERLVRAHGNFVETTPLLLIALALMALSGFSAMVVHVFGAAFLASRASHAYGLSTKAGPSPGRMVGMIGTFTVSILVAVALILRFVGLL